LELEKQQLMATNQHLQRLVDSIGTNNNNNNNNDCSQQQQQQQQQIIQQITSSPSTGTAIKKRKLDQVISVQTISDSSDEGLGSMSPEPVTQMIFSNGSTSSSSTITKTHLVSATSVTTINVKDYVNLQNQMETERRHRMQLEEQVKQLEMQVYSSQHPVKYHHHQQQQQHQTHDIDDVDGHVSEEKIILRQPIDVTQDIHYISAVPHQHHQYVVVSASTPESSPKHITICNEDDDNSRTLSSDELHKDDDIKMIVKQVGGAHQKMLHSPKHHHLRIPSILEQAIKAEPKVEVERINGGVSECIMPVLSEETIAVHSPPPARITSSPPAASVTIRTTYPNNSHQRPNLETIVEAIRHLEGDAFDMDEETTTKVQHATQEVPLALTTSNKYHQGQGGQQQQQQVKEPFLKFRQSATSQSGLPTFVSVPQQKVVQQYQQRPGVIVVKQSS
jgi:transcription factor AP-4